MSDWIKSLVAQVSAWPTVTCHNHRFGVIEFRVGSRQIGHVHRFGIVDIPFSVAVRDELIRSGKAERHHWLPDSGWTTVRIDRHGIENAVELLRLSYERITRKISLSSRSE
jgi:hypothetical protein